MKIVLFTLIFILSHSVKAETSCISHRGSFKYSPENTIQSMREALDLGADGVEFDIQHTKDGHPLIMHDGKLTTATHLPGKTCPLEKRINELTLSEIKENCGIQYQDGFINIPTLDELLIEVSGSEKFVFIELKDPPTAETSRIIEHHFQGRTDKLRIIAFKVKNIEALKKNGRPEFWKEVKGLDLNVLPFRRHKEYGLNVWDKYFKLRKPKYYSRGKFETSVWTVNSEEKIKKFLELDVDYITTNEVQRCLELKNEIQSFL